jgi:hypothetical protein
LESFLARRKKDASYGGKHIFISHWKAWQTVFEVKKSSAPGRVTHIGKTSGHCNHRVACNCNIERSELMLCALYKHKD